MKRGHIILIAGGTLLAIGIAISAVWGVQFASSFIKENTIIAKTLVEAGQSVDARTDVQQLDKPISLAIGVDRTGQTSSDIKLKETIKDPNGNVMSSSEFADSFFTSFNPKVAGVYTVTMSNLGTKPVAVNGAFGYMSFMGPDGKPDVNNMMSGDRGFGMIFTGMGLIVVAVVALIAGAIVLVIDGRNKQRATSSNEGGVTYRKD